MTTRRNRATGSQVTVAKAAELDLCDEGGPWVTICEDHGIIVNHETRKLAERHAAFPQWCADCEDFIVTDADHRAYRSGR